MSAKPKPADPDEVPTALNETEADLEQRAEYGASRDPRPAFFYVERGPGMGQLLELKDGTVVIGRASTSDLRLRHASISRRHVEVRREGERFFLTDLGSQNGTYVNKVRAPSQTEVFPGDTIFVGSAVIRLRGPMDKVGRQRRAPPAHWTDTAVVVRPMMVAKRERPRALLAAIFFAAVGFGLAGAFGVALSRARSTPEAASPPNAIEPVAAELPVEPPAAEALVAPEPPRPTEKARAVPVPTARAASPREVKSAEQILSAYERGDAEGSLRAAQQAQAKPLIVKLTGFLQTYSAGKRALGANDTAAALVSFQKAREWDEQLSSGWGKYGGELRQRLAQLHVGSAKQHEAKGDTEAARKAYATALLDDPGNEAAKAGLERTQKKAPASSPDEAFDEPPPAPPGESKKAAAQSIDDAFGH